MSFSGDSSAIVHNSAVVHSNEEEREGIMRLYPLAVVLVLGNCGVSNNSALVHNSAVVHSNEEERGKALCGGVLLLVTSRDTIASNDTSTDTSPR